MFDHIEKMVNAYEDGRLTRRQLIARIGAFAAAAGAGGTALAAPKVESTFRAVGLNHVALRVRDVNRSRDFYRKHLGLSVRRQESERACFLDCGPDFVALFRGQEAGLDHYCYSIPGYEPDREVRKLKAAGLDPRREENRIYFDDPDGITVQIAAPNHDWKP